MEKIQSAQARAIQHKSTTSDFVWRRLAELDDDVSEAVDKSATKNWKLVGRKCTVLRCHRHTLYTTGSQNATTRTKKRLRSTPSTDAKLKSICVACAFQFSYNDPGPSTVILQQTV
jgi:hypothetical protein